MKKEDFFVLGMLIVGFLSGCFIISLGIVTEDTIFCWVAIIGVVNSIVLLSKDDSKNDSTKKAAVIESVLCAFVVGFLVGLFVYTLIP